VGNSDWAPGYSLGVNEKSGIPPWGENGHARSISRSPQLLHCSGSRSNLYSVYVFLIVENTSIEDMPMIAHNPPTS
jgi:hypothetical protein